MESGPVGVAGYVAGELGVAAAGGGAEGVPDWDCAAFVEAC